MELLLIGGDRFPADSGETTTLINPATGEAWIEVAVAGVEDVDRAVRVADEARAAWRKINSRDRTRILLTLAALIREQSESLAQLESRNVGKPSRDARDEVQLAADCFEYYAGAINNSWRADDSRGCQWHQPHLPRANWRLRTDCPLELSDRHHRLESGTCFGNGQYDHAQACLPNSFNCLTFGRTGTFCRCSGRCFQCRSWLWRCCR